MELWRKIVLGDTYDDKGKEFMLTLINFLDSLTLINSVYYKEEFTRKLLVYLLLINNFLFIVNVLMMFTRLFIDLSSLMWGINIVILFTFYYWKNYTNKLLDFKKILSGTASGLTVMKYFDSLEACLNAKLFPPLK
ncbi:MULTISPECIES: hypothetical protein [unclassified Stygiolobus]|uniref:hypothetical protein n=1 Tax=unclassified Stygiolobus TaxID=2824672 RepID=UPI00307D7726